MRFVCVHLTLMLTLYIIFLPLLCAYLTMYLSCLCACCSCVCGYRSCLCAYRSCVCGYHTCLCAYTVCLSCPYMLAMLVHLHDPCACLFSGYNFELNFFLSHIVVYSPCVSCFVYYTVYDWLDGCTRKPS